MQSSEIDAEVSIAFEKVWGQLTTHQRVDINAITSQLVGKTYNEENMHGLQSDFALTHIYLLTPCCMKFGGDRGEEGRDPLHRTMHGYFTVFSDNLQ